MSLRHGQPALTCLCFSLAFLPLVATADDKKAEEPKVIAAAEAKDHLGETLTVELTVKSSKNASSVESYFLDSEEDYKDEKNLAVVIAYDHAAKFKEQGISDPAEHYLGKTIRVTGKIVKEGRQTRLRISDPKQLKVIEKKKS
jgi:hypothetical protein